jgi:hypothetical protein
MLRLTEPVIAPECESMYCQAQLIARRIADPGGLPRGPGRRLSDCRLARHEPQRAILPRLAFPSRAHPQAISPYLCFTGVTVSSVISPIRDKLYGTQANNLNEGQTRAIEKLAHEQARSIAYARGFGAQLMPFLAIPAECCSFWKRFYQIPLFLAAFIVFSGTTRLVALTCWFSESATGQFCSIPRYPLCQTGTTSRSSLMMGPPSPP